MSDVSNELLAKLGAVPGVTAFAPPPALLQLATELLEAVKTGQVKSLAVLVVDPRGVMKWPSWGSQATELITAAEFLRDDIKAAVRQQTQKVLR